MQTYKHAVKMHEVRGCILAGHLRMVLASDRKRIVKVPERLPGTKMGHG